MQSPPKTAVFESDLAPLLSAFVAEKQRFGFKYNSIEAYLKSFDTFLLGRDCKNSLSKELMKSYQPLQLLEQSQQHFRPEKLVQLLPFVCVSPQSY